MKTKPIRNFKYYCTLNKDLIWHAFRRLCHRAGVHREKRQLGPVKSTTSQRLSTCIITMDSARRIAPLIRYAKTFSDEVVIGVDSKTTDNTFEVCRAAGADIVFYINNDSLTCNAGLDELVKACSGDWILRLDDDEYIEPEFVRLKNYFMEQSHFSHFKLPRLHLSSVRPLQWVNDGYFYPDYQMRLFKNDLTLLEFPGAVGHTSITSSGKKGRIYTINIVHLNLAINSREAREEKLHRYIIRHNGGWVHPINEYALLYEDFNYKIQPYRHPDAGFCELLTSVVEDYQRAPVPYKVASR